MKSQLEIKLAPTPETDKSVRTFQAWDVPSARHVMVEYVFVHTAKRLERERNELREKVWELTTLLQENGIIGYND